MNNSTSKNIIKENNLNTNNDISVLIDKKIIFFQDIIQKTILYVQQNKILDILGVSEVNSCIQTLYDLSKKLIFNIEKKEINTEDVINNLQIINNELSTLFKSFGTYSLEDLLWVCFGNSFININNELDKSKFELLKKYFHPTSYKILLSKKQESEKNCIDIIQLNEYSTNLDCSNINLSFKSFHLKVHGIQIIIHNEMQKKSLIISGLVDDVIINILNNKFINNKIQQINENIPNSKKKTA